MSLRIRNRWKYKGNDSWDWEALIEDNGTGELQKVEYIEYILHPTFRDPIRKVTTRDNNFLMETGGWGTFQLKAFAYMTNGTKQRLTHTIRLEYEPPQGISP